MSADGAPVVTREGENASSAVRIALLDGRAERRERLEARIAKHSPDLQVVVSAGSWPDLVQSPQFPAEIVLLDFPPTGPVSIEARVRSCRAAGATVLVLSNTVTSEARQRVLDAGAAVFLPGSAPSSEVVDRIRLALRRRRGENVSWRPLPGRPVGDRPRLSRGEEQALRLYAAGYSTSEVGARMNVQYETAKTFLRRVREKYARVGRPASKRAELIRRAAEDGILD